MPRLKLNLNKILLLCILKLGNKELKMKLHGPLNKQIKHKDPQSKLIKLLIK